MRLEQLEQLILISKEKSFNAASENLNISHQALNTSIKKLEEEIGVPLIKRTHRGLSFTPAGEKMVVFSRNLLNQYYALVEELRQATPPTEKLLQGNLHIYATSVYMISILPDTIKNFKSQQKDINTLLYTLNAKAIITKMATNRENSIGLINIPDHEEQEINTLLENHQLQFHPLFRSNMCFCVSHTSSFAQKGKQSLSTIFKNPMVILTSSQDNESDITSYTHFMKETKIALATSSYTIWLDAVMQNTGIGMLYDIALSKNSALAKDLDKIVTISTREKISATLGYITANPSELVSSFIHFFNQYNQAQFS